MSSEYHDEIQHKKINPLAPSGMADFDWEELFSRLDGNTEGMDDATLELLAKAFTKIHAYASEPLTTWRGRKASSKFIEAGKRLAALLWVLRPDSFSDSDESMTAVAGRFGMHKAVLSERTSEVSRRLKLRNRFQSHGTLGGHRKRLKKDHGNPAAN